MEQKHLVICQSTSHMLRADAILRGHGFQTSLIPAPAEYGSVCSTAIQIDSSRAEEAKKLLKEAKIQLKGIYPYRPRKLSGLMERLKNNIIRDEYREVLVKIEEGEDLDLEEITLLLEPRGSSEEEALFHAADRMRREVVGEYVDLRGAVEFSNWCIKNCKYCGIRKGMKGLLRYRMTEDEIMEVVHQIHRLGIKTVILQSGEDPFYDTGKIVDLIKRIKRETGMLVTLSLGERTYEEYRAFREAGANNYLLKIETTNRDLFTFIHPDDDFDYRLQCIKWLRELGYINGSGNIIGLPGQTARDIAKDIAFFKEMGIHMIGIGPFLPAKGTPFEEYPGGSVDMTLRAVAVTRLVCKNVFIPATTALASIDPGAQAKALMVGANTIMLICTPHRYRENYQIYSNKNMVDLNAALQSIRLANRKPRKGIRIMQADK